MRSALSALPWFKVYDVTYETRQVCGVIDRAAFDEAATLARLSEAGYPAKISRRATASEAVENASKE